MAVQGAAPRSIAPARYCLPSEWLIHGLKMTRKNRLAKPYMVNGLTSQFDAVVTTTPLGFFPAWRMLLKSIFSIIG